MDDRGSSPDRVGPLGPLRRFLRSDDEVVGFLRELVSGLLLVGVAWLLLLLRRIRLAFGTQTARPTPATTHASTTSTNATSIDPVRRTWTTTEPRTPTTA